MSILTFSQLLQRHRVGDPLQRRGLQIVERGRRNLLSVGMNKMAHDTGKDPVLPVLMGSLHHVIGKLIRQVPFGSYQTVFVHAKYCPVVRKVTLKVPIPRTKLLQGHSSSILHVVLTRFPGSFLRFRAIFARGWNWFRFCPASRTLSIWRPRKVQWLG